MRPSSALIAANTVTCTLLTGAARVADLQRGDRDVQRHRAGDRANPEHHRDRDGHQRSVGVGDILGHGDRRSGGDRADAETKRKAIENAYEPLTPNAMPDLTSDPSLISWLDSLGR